VTAPRLWAKPKAVNRSGELDVIIKTLSDMKDFDDFKTLYEQNNLSTDQEKIDFLVNTMKIKAIHCDEEETPEIKLLGLEELALLNPWLGQANHE
jgi:hypothetical protein